MSRTGESSSRRTSRSTASRSAPTRTATRSFRRPSRAGVATRGALLRDGAVFDLNSGAGREALHLGHREAIADFGHFRDRDLFVQVAEDFAGDGMHDGNTIAAQAEERARTHPVGRREVDGDADGIHEEDDALAHG